MKIDDKEIKLKITPTTLLKIENQDENFNILSLIYKAQEGKEPRMTDYYKVCYVGYLGATNENITFEDFLEKVKDIHFTQINKEAVDLLIGRKN